MKANKVYYDLEFLEGSQTERLLGIELRKWNFIYMVAFGLFAFALFSINYLSNSHSRIISAVGWVFTIYAIFLSWNNKESRWKTPPTIDLISIGMVDADNREYYAISKDFNLREAWNRYDIKTEYNSGDMRNHVGDTYEVKVYWIRENVLKPIFRELSTAERSEIINPPFLPAYKREFTYTNMKRLINRYGKTNAEIAEKVKAFCTKDILSIEKAKFYEVQHNPIELYGYYSAYDHVGLCWLFGVMNDLPKGFPMLTIDLKQELDRKAALYFTDRTLEQNISYIKNRGDYPKQTNEHSAIHDARWNKKLHEFIQSL